MHLEDNKITEIEGYSCKEGLSYGAGITRPMEDSDFDGRIDGAVNRVLPVITERDSSGHLARGDG